MASGHRRLLALLSLVLVLAVVGCTAPQATDQNLSGTLGEVDGVWYNESLNITASDGLSERELDRLVKRSMARLERVRGLEFKRLVDVEVITRAEYQERNDGPRWTGTAAQWQNQVWEALFVVGEHRDVATVFEETFGASVQGYYLPGRDRIVIVSDSDQPTIQKRTLVHELVHALQDQQFGLDSRPETRDGQMARNGLVEGEASLLPELYLDRCDTEWSCIDSSSSAGSGGGIDAGLFKIVIYPYDQGPSFVESIRAQRGWAGIDGVHDQQPASTEQVIHPDRYGVDSPIDVRLPDRSTGGWSRLDHTPVGERVGEAAIFAMLETNGVIDSQEPTAYRHPVSTGWGGDKLVPYTSEDGEYGYVWNLSWDSQSDAREFYEAYLRLLDTRGAVEQGDDRYLLSQGSFADAFRVRLDGRTVRVVNGPTLDSLADIHDVSG